MHPSDSKYGHRITIDTNGCWIWTGTISVQGRPLIRIHQKSHYAYRVIWEELHGPIPAGLLCCHRCDVPTCVNVADHIFLGTHKDNAADAAAKGRTRPPRPRYGLDQPTAVPVEDAEIEAARLEYATGTVTVAALAERLGSSPTTMGRWLRKETRARDSAATIDREAIRVARLAPCGTRAAYSRHRKAGEPACDACRAANGAYSAMYRRRSP